MNLKSIFILIFGLVFINTNSSAQDLKAGEISVRNISGLTYEATVRIYQHIPTLIPRPIILLNWGDGAGFDTLQVILDGCGNNNTTTSKYVGTHTYAGIGNYVIASTDSFRVANLQNISNSINEKMYLQYQLSINPFWGINNGPSSLNCLVDTFKCCTWVYNSGSVDMDGDSLAYSLVPPTTTNYTMPPATVNPLTGDMTFNPVLTGQYAFSMRIDEWRTISNNSYLIGSTFREMLIVVDSAFLISVNEINVQNQVSIYPNPSNGNFTIEMRDFENAKVEIYNISGKIILKKPLFQNRTQIDLTKHSKGIYFVRVETSKGVVVKKLIYQ